MDFEDFKFIYVSLDYLKAMHDADSEVFFSDSVAYEKKPHLGILINQTGRKYVIPLTSAKPKHALWDDVTATMYRIYEIINIQTTLVDKDDIVVDLKNKELLRRKHIPESEYHNYKQRILSVLEIKKMFPIKDGAYRLADLDLVEELDLEERQRRVLMQKEYEFCVHIKDSIKKKASKIYQKQMDSGKVLKFHCNFKALEQVSDMYKIH